MAAFGGTAPFVFTAFMASSYGLNAIGWLLFAYGILSLSAIAAYPYVMEWKEKKWPGSTVLAKVDSPDAHENEDGNEDDELPSV